MTTDHAAALFQAFVLPHRRDRYAELLKSPKGRAKLRAALPHLRDLDPQYARPIKPSNLNAAAIADELRARGAPKECYVVSESSKLDGQILSLDDALDAVVGRGAGALISCLPGRLGYYEGEDPGERYILERAAV
jgi:hypothetical protein